MSIQNLLNQFVVRPARRSSRTVLRNPSRQPVEHDRQIPSGSVGGAAAGGILVLLVSNKSARKLAGTRATYGGAALLGVWRTRRIRTGNTRPAWRRRRALSPDYHCYRSRR